MARKSKSRLDFEIHGHDMATPALKQVKREVSGLPEKFSKSAGILSMFSSVSTQMGKKVAATTQRLADMGSLVAVGGPIGAGIAGLTAVVAAGTYMWDLYTSEARETLAALKKIQQTNASHTGLLTAHRKELLDVTKALEDWGKKGEQIAKEELAREVQRRETWKAREQATLESMRQQREEIAARVNAELSALEILTPGRAIYAQLQQRAAVQELKAFDQLLAAQEASMKKNESALVVVRELATQREKTNRLKEQDVKNTKKQKQATIEHNKMIQVLTASLQAMDQELLGLTREAPAKMKVLANSIAMTESKMLENAFADQVKFYEEKANLSEAFALKEDKRIQQWEDANAAAGAAAASAIGNGFAQMILDSDNAMTHMIRAVVDAAQAAVMAYAASAAAASAFSQAGIPILGPVLAMTGAGIMFGFVKAFLAKIPQMASGGVVAGGYRGIDSVPLLAQQGERVLSVEQNRSFERLVDMLDRNQAASGGEHYHFTSVVPPISAEITRAVRQVNSVNRRLARLRMA